MNDAVPARYNANDEQMSFYFWLGADGEVSSVTAEEFEDRQDEARQTLQNWLDVKTSE